MSQQSLNECLAELHAQLGGEKAAVDDEHARWGLYQRAMAAPDAWAPLRRALENEPDPAVASSVVLQMLERLPAEEHEPWVRALHSEDKRAYAQRRSQDLQVLEAALGGREVEREDWSVWLQLKLAEQVGDARLLAELAEEGETKRVRATAAERLRAVRRSHS
ncbi:hypothetical protein J7E93_22730 [Streptomyces sp. ISL-36]|uniref:hypothetical protein n=1 Tax=Streptomyces sp. ISL-36 TaxID=2819182 RepID=UPI001BE78D5F|nr:hypothetical protein [Streptomyces sp. ISL-36]MBT2442869.1 hypothetical protein [Streptomyces sp. ISL-36]